LSKGGTNLLPQTLGVRTPYRLDLTVEALRRVRNNPVDVWTPDGRYVRAFSDDDSAAIVSVTQPQPDAIEVVVPGVGSQAKRYVHTVATMLGINVDLRAWYRAVRPIPWLEDLAREFRGLKPPRYPDLWEALCYAIVFQQLSIASASSIMHRLVERLSTPVAFKGVRLHPFPRPQAFVAAREITLRSLGLSAAKAAYLKSAAKDVLGGNVDARALEKLPSDEASLALQAIRGVGAWSAAVILLRGFGRLDVFPPSDSGAARKMKILSADHAIDSHGLLASLGNTRGMLYFHLLLGGLRQG
jgi:DNA-3-methyladenine glycosylase II